MFERFTDRARRVIVLAQEEAQLLRHPRIGTEHIVLALAREGDGAAARALASLGITYESVRAEVEEVVELGTSPPSRGHVPFTPRGKKVLEQSLRAALDLGHNYIGTEHILLGVLRETDSTGAKVLVRLGADMDTAKERVVLALTEAPDEELIGITPHLQAMQAAALDRARAKGHPRAGTDHLLLVLLEHPGSAAERVLREAGVDLVALRGRLEEAVDEAENSTDP